MDEAEALELLSNHFLYSETNDGFIDKIANTELFISSQSEGIKVLEAMRKVDRKDFLQDKEISILNYHAHLASFIKLKFPDRRTISQKQIGYVDTPLPIGNGQTCSQPSMVAYMAKVLELEEEMNVLEVGTGCGYSAAITSRIIGEKGHLVTGEYNQELVCTAAENLENYYGKNEVRKRLTIISGDMKEGYPLKAPYDRIYFTAGVNSILTFNLENLVKQLKPNGKILIPEQEGYLHLLNYEQGKEIERLPLIEVGFVPLR